MSRKFYEYQIIKGAGCKKTWILCLGGNREHSSSIYSSTVFYNSCPNCDGIPCVGQREVMFFFESDMGGILVLTDEECS
jgi:hypothetical protein